MTYVSVRNRSEKEDVKISKYRNIDNDPKTHGGRYAYYIVIVSKIATNQILYGVKQTSQ